MTTTPEGAHSADPVREAAQAFIDRLDRGAGFADPADLRAALAAPMPTPDAWLTLDADPDTGMTGELSFERINGESQPLYRARLAAPEGPAPEPDCWAILTPNGSMLVSPDEAKGRKGAYPLYRAPEAPPPVEARQPPQSELAKSLAWSNDDGWRAQRLATEFHEIYERLAPIFGYETRPDTKQFDPNSKNGKLMIAVCGNILAALAAPAGAIQPPLDHQVGAAVTPLPLDSAGGAPSATAPREHEANEHCWCEPEVDYVDPNTGAKVFVHKQTQ